MAKIIHSIFFVSLLLVSTFSVCSGQLPGMPENDASSGVAPNTPNDVDTGYSSSANEHPTMVPDASQPTTAPLASTENLMSYSGKGRAFPIQDPSATFSLVPLNIDSKTYESQVTQHNEHRDATSFAMPTRQMCPEYWAFYNGAWTQGPSAIFLNKQMNIIVNNDQNQNIWAYELYPNGLSKWYNFGYRYTGLLNGMFLGDMSGWHLNAVYGSQSGWSNELWVYVW